MLLCFRHEAPPPCSDHCPIMSVTWMCCSTDHLLCGRRATLPCVCDHTASPVGPRRLASEACLVSTHFGCPRLSQQCCDTLISTLAPSHAGCCTAASRILYQCARSWRLFFRNSGRRTSVASESPWSQMTGMWHSRGWGRHMSSLNIKDRFSLHLPPTCLPQPQGGQPCRMSTTMLVFLIPSRRPVGRSNLFQAEAGAVHHISRSPKADLCRHKLPPQQSVQNVSRLTSPRRRRAEKSKSVFSSRSEVVIVSETFLDACGSPDPALFCNVAV